MEKDEKNMEKIEKNMGKKKRNMEKKELSGFDTYEAKEHIKELLKNKGISQKTVYEHIGLSQPDFSKRLSANNKSFFQWRNYGVYQIYSTVALMSF